MWKKLGVCCACVSLLALLTSCGGGGGSSAPATITRSNDTNFSRDAKALAARIVPGVVWPALLASMALCMLSYWFALLWRVPGPGAALENK